jgi:hypothetical protein
MADVDVIYALACEAGCDLLSIFLDLKNKGQKTFNI